MSEQEGLLDLHNKVTSVELENLLKMQVQALGENPSLAHALPPLMVWGAPGLGKSSVLRQVAEELGIGFIDVRLAQREPVDVRGLPVPGEDGVKWLVASEWPRDPNSRGIILFDELTAADRSLQVAAYEFILDRRLGELYSVPDGWYICAAGNRAQDRAVATTMSSALANRFLHVEIEEDVESWIAWATAHEVHPSVTGFIRYRPRCLFNQEGENLERGWPSPRSWERVSHMVKMFGDNNVGLLRKVIYGLVGNRAGVEFLEFFKLNATFDDVLAMMTDPSSPVEIPKAADWLYSFCSAVAYLLWKGKTAEEQRARLDGFFRISMMLSADFATMLMMDVMTSSGKVDASRVGLVRNHPQYKAWIGKFGAAMQRKLEIR